MASISDALTNIAQGVTGFFGGQTNDANYAWRSHLGAFLSSQSEVLQNQYKWNLNQGYSFQVRGGPSSAPSDAPPTNAIMNSIVSGTIGELASVSSFTELKLNINPQNITITDPFAISILPTQTGYAVQHAGNIIRDITISGTTGVHPKRGAGGLVRGTLGQMVAGTRRKTDPTTGRSVNNKVPVAFQGGTGIFTGERPGYVHFHLLHNYIKAYVQLKADPQWKNMVLVFNNKKDGESWIIEPISFTMLRSSRMPISYQYNIVLKALVKTTYQPPGAANQFGVFGTFLRGIRYVENLVGAASDFINIGAGIIRQGTDYIRQIESGIEQLIIEPIDQVGEVLRAINSGINTVSPLPRTFYTNLINSVQRVEDEVNDIAGEGSTSYNSRFGRVPLSTTRATSGFYDAEYTILRGLNSIKRGLTLMVSSDLLFSGTTTKPAITSIDVYNPGNSVVLSDAQKSALRHTTANGIERLFDYRMKINQPLSVKITIIRRNETLEDIALRTLQDTGRWTDLAILNGLKYPYIEEVGVAEDGTRGWGDRLYIPSGNTPKTNIIVPSRHSYITRDMTVNEKNLGVDIELNSDSDFIINSADDLDLVAGASNAVQAIQLLLSIEKGGLKYHPGRGVGLDVSITNWTGVQTLLDDIKSNITSDGRFDEVSNLSLLRDGTAVYIDMKVRVADFDESIPIQLAI